ncbi:MAG: hypothetical protein [Anelloviridae sp.]|nr:MAG: hypothetical protein [Anelloviridae sp.]
MEVNSFRVKGRTYVISHVGRIGVNPEAHPPTWLVTWVIRHGRHFHSQNGRLPSSFLKLTARRRRARFARAPGHTSPSPRDGTPPPLPTPACKKKKQHKHKHTTT